MIKTKNSLIHCKIYELFLTIYVLLIKISDRRSLPSRWSTKFFLDRLLTSLLFSNFRFIIDINNKPLPLYLEMIYFLRLSIITLFFEHEIHN